MLRLLLILCFCSYAGMRQLMVTSPIQALLAVLKLRLFTALYLLGCFYYEPFVMSLSKEQCLPSAVENSPLSLLRLYIRYMFLYYGDGSSRTFIGYIDRSLVLDAQPKLAARISPRKFCDIYP